MVYHTISVYGLSHYQRACMCIVHGCVIVSVQIDVLGLVFRVPIVFDMFRLFPISHGFVFIFDLTDFGFVFIFTCESENNIGGFSTDLNLRYERGKGMNNTKEARTPRSFSCPYKNWHFKDGLPHTFKTDCGVLGMPVEDVSLAASLVGEMKTQWWMANVKEARALWLFLVFYPRWNGDVAGRAKNDKCFLF